MYIYQSGFVTQAIRILAQDPVSPAYECSLSGVVLCNSCVSGLLDGPPPVHYLPSQTALA